MPPPEIQPPSEAIRFLKAAGFHAFEREWAIGKSIGVTADPLDHGAIQGWRRMVYIAPTDSGWVLQNLRTTGDRPSLVGSLEQACHQTISALQSWDSPVAVLPPSGRVIDKVPNTVRRIRRANKRSVMHLLDVAGSS